MHKMTLRVFVDSGCIFLSRYAIGVIASNGYTYSEIICSKDINAAELYAVNKGIEYIRELGVAGIVYTDSMYAYELCQIGDIEVKWIPRAANIANTLVNSVKENNRKTK